MNAAIISIGDEFVTGQSVDTNSAWLSAELTQRGVCVTSHVTVGDDVERIAQAIRVCRIENEISILTGGLGPTPDDVTRDAIAAVLGQPLVEDPEAWRQIQAFLQRLQRAVPDSNRRQAMLPRTCEVILNPLGTAPGIGWHGQNVEKSKRRIVETQEMSPAPALGASINDSDVCQELLSGSDSESNPALALGALIGQPVERYLFAFPGVPAEMKEMFRLNVLPLLQSGARETTTAIGRLQCFGMAEARMGELLAERMTRGRNPSVGTTASRAIISVRVVATADGQDDAKNMLEAEIKAIRELLGAAVFGEGNSTLQEALANLLVDQRLTLSTAESCTGGLLAKCLTDVPGSSAYFYRGYITYSNEAKRDLLGVAEEILSKEGSVGEATARAMAEGCRRVAGAELALSITGVAGPDGGSPEKPVGLVYIGLATESETIVRRFQFGEHLSRDEIRDRACKSALNLLRLHLLGIETP